jgi:hypothetical protein
MKQFKEHLEKELADRRANGQTPVTLTQMKQILGNLGYRLDRSMDCRHVARYMAGPKAGRSYPAISTGIKEIDTGKSAFHFEARRDDNFKKLQEMRFNESCFAVVHGCILEP